MNLTWNQKNYLLKELKILSLVIKKYKHYLKIALTIFMVFLLVKKTLNNSNILVHLI